MFRFLFLLALCCAPMAQALQITPESAYTGATFSAEFREDWPEDTGGLLYLFVRNDAASDEKIASITINGKPTPEQENVRWWRAWPETIAPGGCGWVVIKAVGAPLAQGATAKVAVQAVSGATAETEVKCVTPVLRLANVLPSPDNKALLVYLRNDGSETLKLQRLLLNSEEHAIGGDPALTLVGGPELAPGGLAILTLQRDAEFPALAPLALRVCAEGSAGPVYVGAGIRLTEPGFNIGTWSSNLTKEPVGMAYARMLGIDCAVTGRDWNANYFMMEKYHIRTLGSVNTGDPKAPDLPVVVTQKENKSIAAWMVRDEPDLSGKPSSLMALHTRAYLENDANTPTYLNLMTNAGFNEYGAIPDITCMDHYVMHAPNVLPWSGITRVPKMEEALEYTDLLKRNTEPLRMWTWAQLAADVWGRQPVSWGVSYQFWAHIMGGAKGILWFKYGPGFENKYTDQVNAAERVVRQFEQVRACCFYGEVLKNVTAENDKAVGRTLNSPNATVAIVLNSNYEAGGLPIRPRYTLSPLESKVFIPVPAWVPVEQVLAITPDGPQPIDYELKSGVVSLTAKLSEEMGVYLIGKKDTEPPSGVTGFNAPIITGNLIALTWAPAKDNVGVRGYTVYHQGKAVRDVYACVAMFRDTSAVTGSYAVEPFDAAGNRGPRSEEIFVQ